MLGLLQLKLALHKVMFGVPSSHIFGALVRIDCFDILGILYTSWSWVALSALHNGPICVWNGMSGSVLIEYNSTQLYN